MLSFGTDASVYFGCALDCQEKEKELLANPRLDANGTPLSNSRREDPQTSAKRERCMHGFAKEEGIHFSTPFKCPRACVLLLHFRVALQVKWT